MAVHHRRKIVQTVGQCQCLRIGHVLPHLLDTTVDITEVWIDALHGLTINNGLQSEHTVGRWVVRTDVDNIVVLIKATLLCSNEMSILAQGILHGEVILRLISARELVCLRTHIEVLAQWIALEIGAEEKTAHIWVTQELDADEIEDFTLQKVSYLPKVNYCRNYITAIHLLGDGLY